MSTRNNLNSNPLIGNIKKLFLKIDWKLLVFLFLFLDVKMAVKIIAIIFIYCSRFNFRFGLRMRFSRLPFFYVAAIFIALLNLVVYKLYANSHYDIAFLTGIFFWLLCILSIHQLKLSVDTLDTGVLENTLVVFFAVNAFVSVADLLAIIIETGAYNPYRYQGLFQKYFIGTGDYIKGIFFDASTTNAVINAFGVVYFLNRKRVVMPLLCMIVLLLTASNFTNLLLVAVLAGIFFFQSNRDQKSVITICIFFLVLFMVKISPQNNEYAVATFKKIFPVNDNNGKVQPTPIPATPDTFPGPEGEKHSVATLYRDSLKKKFDKQAKQISFVNKMSSPEKALTQPVNTLKTDNNSAVQAKPEKIVFWARPSIPEPDINDREYQNINDTTELQRELVAFAKKPGNGLSGYLTEPKERRPPGKIIALKQTLAFLQKKPIRFAIGGGMGNFSSKLAFRATALKIGGGYPVKYAYINREFLENHLALFVYYFSKQTELHSVINTPDSVYDQLFSEYGIAGFACFVFFYALYFVRHVKNLSYGIPLLFIMASAFFLGYWFEQLSVVVVFELLLLIDIKSGQQPVLHKQEME